MIYPAKEFILKNGAKVLLKTPETSDARLLLDQIIATVASTDYLLRLHEEFDPYVQDMGKEECFIDGFREGNDYLLAAYVDGIIAGNCSLAFSSLAKERHRAKVGIAIRKEYWGQGLGSFMFDEMIALARATPGIEQVELDGGVIVENKRAIALYEKKGFVAAGMIPHQLKLPDGTYLDGQLMTLFL